MVRILAGIAIVITILGAFLFFKSFNKSGPRMVPVTSPLDSSPSGSLADRVDSLEEAVTLLDNKVSQISGTPPVITPSPAPNTPSFSSSDVNTRLSKLETEVADLENRVSSQGSNTTQSSNTARSPIYIPLGSSDPINNTNWTNLDALSVYINPADYPGYTSMQLEVSLRLNAGGTAYAQLFNATAQSTVSNSQVSTTSTTFIPLVSSGFTLPSGKDLYKIQAMDNSGDTMFIQDARIKINF